MTTPCATALPSYFPPTTTPPHRYLNFYALPTFFLALSSISPPVTLSIQPLIMLVFIILIAVIIFSSAAYYAERGEWVEGTGWMRRLSSGELVKSPYESIPASFWCGPLAIVHSPLLCTTSAASPRARGCPFLPAYSPLPAGPLWQVVYCDPHYCGLRRRDACDACWQVHCCPG